MPESKRSSTADLDAWVTVLAGGIGSRFWPASTKDRPKQLLPLASDRPLIVDTLERARSIVPDERIRILAGSHLVGPFQSVLDDLPESCYWVEPQAKGTAPVLAWAAWKLIREDPEAVMVSLHADHLIRPLSAFQETVRTAVHVARSDDLLLSIAVKPSRVEPAYGHVEPGEALDGVEGASAFRVVAFHEKPDRKTAERYTEQGYLWNTGIFVWKAAVLLRELALHAPKVAEKLELIDRSDEAYFDAVDEGIVIDRAVMERSDRVGAVEATFEWDDVGSWEALARTRDPDEDGNVIIGRGELVGSRGSIVYGEGPGSVVLLGAEDLIVVQTDETTMVLPRSRAHEIKDLLARRKSAP